MGSKLTRFLFLFISDSWFLNLIVKAFVVEPTYCSLHFLHEAKEITAAELITFESIFDFV